MRRLIENIRQKPKRIKDQYAFYGATAITGIIAIIWAISVPAGFEKNNESQDMVDENNRPAFSTFFGQMKDQFAGLRTSLDELASSTEEFVADQEQEVDAAPTSSENSLEDIVQESIHATSSKTLEQQPEKELVKYVRIGTTSASNTTSFEE